MLCTYSTIVLYTAKHEYIGILVMWHIPPLMDMHDLNKHTFCKVHVGNVAKDIQGSLILCTIQRELAFECFEVPDWM